MTPELVPTCYGRARPNVEDIVPPRSTIGSAIE